MALDLARARALSFDCYGTLIDWESGILAAVRQVLARHAVTADDGAILAAYADLEPEAEAAAAFRRYRDVLQDVMRGYARRFGFELAAGEETAIVDSLPSWRPFPDSVDALKRLASRYQLFVLSNVDDDLFDPTATALGRPFTDVITAQQVGSYKPDRRNFATLILRVGSRGIVPQDLVHVAESRYHDIATAKTFGLATVWINRRYGKVGAGATKESGAVPDLELTDLKSLADRAGV